MSGYVQPDVEAQTRPQASGSSQPAPQGPTGNMASSNSNAGGHHQSIWEQSSHPVALLFLFLFRGLAIATYLLSGFFSTGFVFSTVVVVLLLSADFWTVKNVSGRVLVGLRFWNQVDESGASYWVFESKDTSSQPNNPVDQKMFWMALYAFPVAWVGLLFVGILKFNLTFIPIVILALVFNITNAIGFTYADRDAKKRWATGIAAQGFSMGGLSGSLVSGLGRAAMGKVFG